MERFEADTSYVVRVPKLELGNKMRKRVREYSRFDEPILDTAPRARPRGGASNSVGHLFASNFFAGGPLFSKIASCK